MENTDRKKTKMKKAYGWTLPAYDKHFRNQLKHFVKKFPDESPQYQKRSRDAALSYVEDFDGVAIDIGANVGFWTVDMANLFERVECFEPVDDNVECLIENIKTFVKDDNVIINKYALSNETDKERELYIDERGCGNHSFHIKPEKNFHTINVPLKKLDDFGYENVKFIKSDVQFHELEVLQGAKKTIEICKPVLCIELVARNEFEINIRDSVIHFLESMEYELAEISGKENIFVHRTSRIEL